MNLNEAYAAVESIRQASPDVDRLRNACVKHRKIFAVHPQLIQMLPQNARDILLSSPESEQDDSLRVTTPAEIDRFYGKAV